MNKRHLLLPCLLLVSALTLAACGGGGGESDESKIEKAIETAATSSDPSKCTEVETQKFVEHNTQAQGAAAIKACEKEAKQEENASSVDVSEVEVEGDEATADAAITGSSFDGQTLEVALVEEEGSWKVNEFTGFAKLDQAALVQTLKEGLEESSQVSPELAGCIVEGFEEASQAEVEEFVLSGSSKGLEELARECS